MMSVPDNMLVVGDAIRMGMSPFIASGEPPHQAQPSKGSLDNPAMTAEPLNVLDTPAGYAGLDATPPTRAATAPMIVCLVRMELVGATARPPRAAR